MVARADPPINHNPLYLKMNYIRHRMNNDPATRQAYNDLCATDFRSIPRSIGFGNTPFVFPGRSSSEPLTCF